MFPTTPRRLALRWRPTPLILALAAASCTDLPLSPTGDEYGDDYENFDATPPRSCSPDGALSVGATRQGALEEGDCAQFPGDRYDRWTLSLDEETQIRLDMRSDAFDTMLELLNARGDMIAFNDDSYGTLNSMIATSLPPGDYDVIARSYAAGMRGRYELGLDIWEGCGPTTEVVLGEELAGEITDDDCLMDQWMPADSFTLDLDVDRRMSFTVKSADFSPFLMVRHEYRGDVFVAYDDMGTGTARGRVTLEAGRYVVYVAPNGPALGAYQLMVEEVACEAPRPLALGRSVEGTLDELDCVRAGGAFLEAWSLELDAERTVRIDMASAVMDAWLAVTGENGEEIGRDDDSGPGFDASLTVTLGPGRYTVLASSFGPGDVGDYTLSVVEEAPPDAGVAPALAEGAFLEDPAGVKEAEPITRGEDAGSLLLRLGSGAKDGR